MKNNWYTYFIYLSIIFLLVGLASSNYLFIPEIHHISYLVFSLFLLFAGFISTAIPWHKSIQQMQSDITSRDSIISIGIPVFSKYLPGKVWSIIGPPGYIAKIYPLSIKRLSAISLDNQLLTLWTGLILGSGGLLINGIEANIAGIFFLFWLALSVAIFTNTFHGPIEKMTSKILKRNIHIPRLDIVSILRILPYYFLNWIIWCIGFYFFAQSLASHQLPLQTGLGFALAATLGIMAIIAPGGIGVREGIITSYLVASGIGLDEAATISVASRLWFLMGECFIFLLAIFLRKSPRKSLH